MDILLLLSSPFNPDRYRKNDAIWKYSLGILVFAEHIYFRP